jgi:hypothetical protein
MKRIQILTLAAMAVLVMAACGRGSDRAAQVVERLEPGEIPAGSVPYAILPAQSVVAWEGSKVTGKHDGTIGVQSGNIYVYEGYLVGGTVYMDMENLVVLDLEDPDMNARLTGHLKSDDFFSVETYPTATFEFLRFEELDEPDDEGNNYKVTGNLTIKGITHTIAFNANIHEHDNQIHALADFDLDRTLWDVRFRSGRFYENLGDNLIHDHFNLKLDVVASR